MSVIAYRVQVDSDRSRPASHASLYVASVIGAAAFGASGDTQRPAWMSPLMRLSHASAYWRESKVTGAE